MTPEAFRAWRKGAGLTQAEAGKALGKSRLTIIRYEQNGLPAEDRVAIALAIQALNHGLKPWTGEDHSPNCPT